MAGYNKKTGDELFSNGHTLLGFWQWAHSDILGNAERGRLAEYIVAMALDISDSCRVEWNAYDLETKNGLKIEVKSSGYLQEWKQNHLSEICFDIRPTRLWYEGTNKYSVDRRRRADIYVFCVFTCIDIGRANPLDLEQWTFYVLKTSDLNQHSLSQKRISLNSLQKLPVMITGYQGLKETIEKAASDNKRI